MASNARDVEYDIIANDKTARGTRSAIRNATSLKRRIDAATSSTDSWSKSVSRISRVLLSAVKTVARVTASVAAYTSLVGPATVATLAAAKAVVTFGKALAGLAPLVAFLPSLAGALALVAGTIRLAAPGLVKALEPITRQFFDAEGEATRLTLRLRELAARGVEPLARQFVRVNFGAIAAGMSRIAVATNSVVVGVGRWLNTTEGQRLIRSITEGTAAAVERLAPKVTAAAIALGRLAGRAGDRAITGLADLIGRTLDAFTRWANSTSIRDIQQAVSDLSGYLDRLRNAFHAVRDIGKWMAENEGKVRAFATALGVLGVALGILTGNPFAVAIAGFTLLVTNWDKVRSKLSGAAEWWSGIWTRIKNDPAIQGLVQAVVGHFQRLWPILQQFGQQLNTTVLPELRKLGQVVLRDVVPAVAAFINAVSPFVAWWVSHFLPAVVSALTTAVRIVTSGLKIIAGIFNLISALITGDWSRLWKGLGQILSGAVGVLAAIVRGLFSSLRALFSGGLSALLGLLNQWKSRVVGVFHSAGSWLSGVGRAIVDGLVRGILSQAGSVSSAVRGLVDRAKSAIPGPLRGLVPFSSANSWRPAQVMAQFAAGGNLALAGAGGGTSRTGGPTPVSVDVTVVGELAELLKLQTRTIVADRERTRWRDRVGNR